jgi:lysozyme
MTRSSFLPPRRPLQSEGETRAYFARTGIDTHEKAAILGIRGYYRRTMGDPAKNDRGIYDDALFLISPNAHAAFNANTDPGVHRKHIATLRAGLWLYKIGIHGLSKPPEKRYTALVQADKVEVLRDGEASERGMFGINIHRGGRTTTSSIGCQTVWPDQWEAFIALVKSEMKHHSQTVIPYLLIDPAA